MAKQGMDSLMAQHSNLDTMVRESLRSKIISGDLDGGVHLSELKISKEYNVSRTPVREALCALAADGLVEMVPHRGAFVSHIPTNTKTDQVQAYGLFVGLVAKMATEKANIEMLMDLETAFSFSTEDKPQLPEVYMENMSAALDMMEKVANSPTISEAMGMVSRRMNVADIWQTVSSPSSQKDMNNQLTLLLAAIKRKKPDAAEKTARQMAYTAINGYLAQRKLPTTTTETTEVYGESETTETRAAA